MEVIGDRVERFTFGPGHAAAFGEAPKNDPGFRRLRTKQLTPKTSDFGSIGGPSGYLRFTKQIDLDGLFSRPRFGSL